MSGTKMLANVLEGRVRGWGLVYVYVQRMICYSTKLISDAETNILKITKLKILY